MAKLIGYALLIALVAMFIYAGLALLGLAANPMPGLWETAGAIG